MLQAHEWNGIHDGGTWFIVVILLSVLIGAGIGVALDRWTRRQSWRQSPASEESTAVPAPRTAP